VLKCFQYLLIDRLIGLCKVFSALGMSDNHVFNACIGQHIRGNLAGVSTFLLEIHIFSADCDVGSLARFYNRDNINRRYAEYNVYIFRNNEWLQKLYQSYCLRRRHVHFPVACYDLSSSHDYSIPLFCLFICYCSRIRAQ